MPGSLTPRRAVLGTALIGAAALAVCAVYRRGPAPGAPLPVSWRPATPRQAAALVFVVGPDSSAGADDDSVVAVRGSFAGEPLRFERGLDGRYRALAGVPVSAAPSMLISMSVVRVGGDTSYQVMRAPVQQGDFPLERIRLPARYVTPPESLRARLAEERRTIRAALARAAQTPRLWSGAFEEPVPVRVNDVFGTRREVNRRVENQHLGVDLAGRSGTPVRATNRGVVAVAGRFYFQGNAVYLDHGAGLMTSYMHFSRILVAAGDTVEAGQVIGLVGATGRVTGPHLHWAGYFGRVTFDPLTLLTPELRREAEEWGPPGP